MRRKVKPNIPVTFKPVDLLRELLEDHELTDKDLLAAGVSERELAMLDGPDPRFDEDLSARLASVFGLSSNHFAKLDARYRKDLAEGKPVSGVKEDSDFSGNVRVRLPAYLHRRLSEAAQKQGMSLNSVALALIAEGLGRMDRPA